MEQVIGITHKTPHIVPVCFYYLEFLLELLEGKDKMRTYHHLQERLPLFLRAKFTADEDMTGLSRFINSKIYERPSEDISGTGELVQTLEAALWCFLNTESFKEATLKAVNLGFETNVTASVAGALAGIYYGASGIPASWLNHLAKRKAIEALADAVFEKVSQNRNK